ncbi:AarF/ABC1/UbiB kinase family protein [Gordonia malaquae]|uniref:ABC1 kinase family protein n=1 Tax=Gordonia malaquae TaxID=410332 RepID=UPI0030FE233B
MARDLGVQVATIGKGADERRSRRESSGAAAAAQFAKVLGGMKGGATKIGQMLSMIDLSALPSAYREPLQSELGSLLDSVPEVPFPQMRDQIERGVQDSLESVFAEFDTEPVGSASIGQVYRAVLADGRRVAVKVKYPGVDQAVESDIRNLVAFVKFWRRALPIGGAKELVAEVADALRGELDYEAEASNQRRAAALYRGHPFVVVPDVVPELCGSDILVTEWFDGSHFDEWHTLSQRERDRLGEIIFRFYVGGIYRNSEFCADPHPGNVLLGSDGRVGFVDYGAYKVMTPGGGGVRGRHVERRGAPGCGDALRPCRRAGDGLRHGFDRPGRMPRVRLTCVRVATGSGRWASRRRRPGDPVDVRSSQRCIRRLPSTEFPSGASGLPEGRFVRNHYVAVVGG